jgi:hypothetical protein
VLRTEVKSGAKHRTWQEKEDGTESNGGIARVLLSAKGAIGGRIDRAYFVFESGPAHRSRYRKTPGTGLPSGQPR